MTPLTDGQKRAAYVAALAAVKAVPQAASGSPLAALLALLVILAGPFALMGRSRGREGADA